MLTYGQLDLIWNIEVACQRCIRASQYFNVVSGTRRNLWAFTQNCYGGICVVHWCQVFGSRSEPTHYSRIFESGAVSTISKEEVSKKLHASVGMNDDQYMQFWQSVKDARDKFLVHNEFSSSDRPVFPDLAKMADVCLEMRKILLDIIESESSENPKYQGDIRHFISSYTNDRLVSEITNDLPDLKQALSKRG